MKTPEYITFVLEEGLGNSTKAITSYLTKNIVNIIKNVDPTKIEGSKLLTGVINIAQIDPNLNILKKKVTSLLDNPFLLNLELTLITAFVYDIPGASYNSKTNTLKVDVQLDKSDQKRINQYIVTQLYSVIEHEMRHWYQRNFWNDPTGVYKAFIETIGFHDINNRYLSSFEIDSYVRGWLIIMQQIPNLNIANEWVAFMVGMWDRIDQLVKDINLSLQIVNTNVVPNYYQKLKDIQPKVANQIKVDNITIVDIKTYIKHATALERSIEKEIKTKQLMRKHYTERK